MATDLIFFKQVLKEHKKVSHLRDAYACILSHVPGTEYTLSPFLVALLLMVTLTVLDLIHSPPHNQRALTDPLLDALD